MTITSSPPLLPRCQMMGFTAPTSGTALVNQVDISEDVRSVYTMIGVCPQHE